MKKEVCLILDDKIFLEVIRGRLVMEGYTVFSTSIGNLNMAVYLAQKPDAIVLSLKDLDGFHRFFSQLDPLDGLEVYYVPIILFSPVEEDIYLTSAAIDFKVNKSTSISIIDTIMHHANTGTL